MQFNQLLRVAGLLLACALLSPAAQAQQTTGAPGSPDATTTIDGRYLPPPPQPFQGEIDLNARQSKPAWPARIVPPKGAPNILLILTDDVGFGAPSTFGGVIPTPALDRIAANGLRYTNFHSTSLCSPTRAALITGRNHHSVGFGVISESRDRLPRLQQRHRQGQRHDWPHSPRERLQDLVVRQEPQHAGLSDQPGGAVRPVADRHGLLSTSTASWAATPTSGRRARCSATPRISSPSSASRSGT